LRRLASDITSIGSDLVRLLKAREIDAAISRINDELRRASRKRYEVSADAVATLTRSIKATQQELSLVLAEIDKLPMPDRLHAGLDLKPLIDRLFNDEIARLRSEKRYISRPA
jgi:hypothetical protein